jgi:conjugal transfer pilus assembly protein TraW
MWGPGAVAVEQIAPVYPIVEPDMLKEIQEALAAKARSGALAALQREAIARSKDHIENPTPVKEIARTTVPRSHYVDPSYVAPQTVTGPSGEIVVRAGDRVNPLDYTSLTQRLVFFDARDPEQVERVRAWIATSPIRMKPILIGGPVFELTRQWKRTVYFDQGGVLVRRFGITQVPALVYQDGRRLRVDEVLVR